MSSLLCIGHRGASGLEPENTLRSIRRALALGADGVEIDVWLVAGELVVFHDAKLERTTNGRGLLTRKTLGYLRSLDAGSGERIPFLREVFALVNRRAVINIELKGPGTALAVQALIGEWIDHHAWQSEHFIVSSFRRRELRALTDPRIRIGLLVARPSRLYSLSARRVRAWSVHAAARFVTGKFVADAHRRGYLVFAYTVNTAAEIHRLQRLGADGVFTDFPDRMKAWVQ